MNSLLIALAVPAMLFLIYVLLVMPRIPRRSMDTLRGRDYAHRGLWNVERPENSLAAFDAAAGRGYGIELDVQLTADGALCVFHDNSLRRMTGTDGDIRECTLAQLAPLRLRGTGERIPAFAQALETVRGRVPLIVELKTCSRIEELCEKVWALLRDYPGVYCVESFDPRAVRWFRKNAPQVLRGQLVQGWHGLPAKEKTALTFLMSTLVQNCLGRPDFIACNTALEKSLSMRLMRKIRPWLVVWTVRSQDLMARLRGQYDLFIFEGFLP